LVKFFAKHNVCVCVCVCVCIYIYIYIHTHTHIYIYIYIERERERGGGREREISLKRDNVKYLIPWPYLLNELILTFTTKITDFISS